MLGYLRKVGNPWRAEILKDRRSYPRPEGGEIARGVLTWREAHRILVEIEETQDSTRCLVAAVGLGDGDPDGGRKIRRKRGPKDTSSVVAAVVKAVNAAMGNGSNEDAEEEDEEDEEQEEEDEASVAAVPPGEKKVCFAWRDEGKCSRGKECRFAHGEEKPKAKVAPKIAAVPPAQSKSKSPSKELCLKFIAGRCSLGDKCKYSHAAKKLKAVVAAVASANSQADEGGQQQSQQAGAALARIRPPSVHAVFPAGHSSMIASVASNVTEVVGELQSLADLPKDVWELVKEPPSGYQFRTHAYTPGVTWDTLLDGGAAFS